MIDAVAVVIRTDAVTMEAVHTADPEAAVAATEIVTVTTAVVDAYVICFCCRVVSHSLQVYEVQQQEPFKPLYRTVCVSRHTPGKTLMIFLEHFYCPYVQFSPVVLATLSTPYSYLPVEGVGKLFLSASLCR